MWTVNRRHCYQIACSSYPTSTANAAVELNACMPGSCMKKRMVIFMTINEQTVSVTLNKLRWMWLWEVCFGLCVWRLFWCRNLAYTGHKLVSDLSNQYMWPHEYHYKGYKVHGTSYLATNLPLSDVWSSKKGLPNTIVFVVFWTNILVTQWF